MPVIRLFNPSRRRRSRGGRRRKRRVVHARKHHTRRRRNRNLAAGGGALTIMANKRRRRKKSRRVQARPVRRRRHRRRRNPVLAANPRRRRRPRYGRRRRNPIHSFADLRSLGTKAAWAIAGGVVTRSVPQMVLGPQNAGAFGYLANGVTAVASAMLAERFVGKEAGQAVLIGGAVMLSGRLVEDFVGKKLVEFTGLPSLLGCDYKYDLSGEFIHSPFPVPVSSQVPGIKGLPAVSPEAAAVRTTRGMGDVWPGPWSN